MVNSDSEHSTVQPEVRLYSEPEALTMLKCSFSEFLRRGEGKDERRNRALILSAFHVLRGNSSLLIHEPGI